jgi:hypothetical protein
LRPVAFACAPPNPPRIEFKGFDAEHAVTGLTCENVIVNSQPLTSDQIKCNDFVRDVRVTP